MAKPKKDRKDKLDQAKEQEPTPPPAEPDGNLELPDDTTDVENEDPTEEEQPTEGEGTPADDVEESPPDHPEDQAPPPDDPGPELEKRTPERVLTDLAQLEENVDALKDMTDCVAWHKLWKALKCKEAVSIEASLDPDLKNAENIKHRIRVQVLREIFNLISSPIRELTNFVKAAPLLAGDQMIEAEWLDEIGGVVITSLPDVEDKKPPEKDDAE